MDIQPPPRTVQKLIQTESENAVYCINCKWMGDHYEHMTDYALCDCPDNRDVYIKSSPIHPPYTVSHRQYCTNANKDNDCKYYTPLPDAPPVPKRSLWSRIVQAFNKF